MIFPFEFRRTAFVAVLALLALCAEATDAHAQLGEDGELTRGLLARYSMSGQSVQKLEHEVSADWGASSPLQEFGESTESFSVVWDSRLLVQQEGDHQFHAFVQGKVRVVLGAETVFSADSKSPSWVSSDAFTPDLGFQPIKIHFEKTASKAQLHLYWSSKSFPLEPLPGHLLFRDGGRFDLAAIEKGREQYEAFRCGNCHGTLSASGISDDGNDTAAGQAGVLAAPDLKHSVTGIPKEWITRKLMGHLPGTMPGFEIHLDQAQAIATALLSTSVKRKLKALPEPARGSSEEKDRQSGLTLIRSLGCLACHTIEDVGLEQPGVIVEQEEGIEHGNSTVIGQNVFGGGSLATIGDRRLPEWLYVWLSDPAALNPSHRMPVFDLSSQERRQVAVALASLKAPAETKPEELPSLDSSEDELISQGWKLIRELGCSSCHKLSPRDGAEIAGKVDAPLLIGNRGDTSPKEVDWQQSCAVRTAPGARKSGQPTYRAADFDAIQAFVESLGETPRELTRREAGQQLLTTRSCLACHPRGQTRGLADVAAEIVGDDLALRGQAPTLVPPSLTAIGDRMLDKALAKAVGGEQKRRMDWKAVRMPKFKHSDAERQALIEYLVSEDRIQDGTPTWDISDDTSQVDDQTLLIGQELVGPKGFSCIACHQIGDYVPKKAAMGTRGSDLVGLGERIRHSYFIRWTRSPLRVVPGVEMPSYVKPVAGVLHGDIDVQLETLWRTLADPRFIPPTNPASVEQFIVVTPRSEPRIIRDVFTNPDQNGGGYVARAFAIGADNGHSLLIDLDSLAIRRWTFGDFARQRTVGKSWYWDMAGSDVVAINDAEPDFALVSKETEDDELLDSLIWPKRENGTVGRLLSYPARSGARPPRSGDPSFVYRMSFQLEGQVVPVEIMQRFNPIDSKETNTGEPVTGWHHWIEAEGVPDAYDLVHFPVLISSKTERLGEPSPTPFRDKHGYRLIHGPFDEGGIEPLRAVRIISEHGTASIANAQLTSLGRPALEVPVKPVDASKQTQVTSLPGYEGSQLPLSTKIMPTAMTVLNDGKLAFTSLEGHVYLAKDSDGDGVEDELTMFEEGLAAPYGIIEDEDRLLVSHKPELVRLRDRNGDGRADERTVFATGWGFNDNYHDWSCGIVRDRENNLFVGLGSDYSQPKRPKDYSRWRGTVVKISPDGEVQPFSHAFRYPTGIAIDANGNLFASDNQGVQNTFNEINHLRAGHHFGVPKMHEQSLEVDAQAPAIQVPHPWVRSVNGITILPEDYVLPEIAGHGLGCEYEERLLIRFTYHEVDGILQGATYYFSKPGLKSSDENFLGPLSISTGPAGELYVGSIHDSGWLGGLNTGSIVRLTPSGALPNGIREIQATSDGFEIQFFHPVDSAAASRPDSYSISGYTRVWKGSYSTPDSGRFQPSLDSVTVSPDGRTARIRTSPLKTGFVYEINCRFKDGDTALWPATGHYTLHRIPRADSQ